MKRLVVLILMAALLLSGCSAWLDGEYHSVKPHAFEGAKLSDDIVKVSSYFELRSALLEMVNSGSQQSTFYITGFGLDAVDQYMNAAVMYVFENSAIGAYAVDAIDFECGTSGGNPAIAVDISYIHGRQEILRIKNTTNMDEVKSIISAALSNCDASTVIKVQNYEDLDVELFVQEYVNANPHLCMQLPQVSASIYPEEGNERVLEISFTYQISRDTLRTMQNTIAPIFSAAELYVQSSDSESQKYEQLYSFLMERFDYKIETSLTPAYSLIRYGVGDSSAFARVYSTMCRNADLYCSVVSGTKNGEAYHWNIIRYDGTDYHVDLLECSEAGEFVVMVPEMMDGYVWDYSGYQ